MASRSRSSSLLGFDSDGEPVLAPPKQSDKGLRSRDKSGELPVFDTPLRNFGETLRTLRPRPRRNTDPNDITVIAAKRRAAAKRDLLDEKRRLPSVGGTESIGARSLEWDNSGQVLQRETSPSRLWSVSTNFDVPVSPLRSEMSDTANLGSEGGNATTPNGESSPPASINAPSGAGSFAPIPSDGGSAADTTLETVVNGGVAPSERPPATGHPSGSGPLPLTGQPSAVPPPPKGTLCGESATEIWTALIWKTLKEADDLILPWKGKRAGLVTTGTLRDRAENVLSTLRDGQDHCDEDLQARVVSYRSQIAQICVDLEQHNLESDSDSDARSRASSRCHSPPPTTLDFDRRTVKYLLSLISEDNLPDVALGSSVDNETLKELYDVKAKEMLSLIKDCRDATRKYSTCHGADPKLIDRSLAQCEAAYEWTRQVTDRFRGHQLHLSGNMLAKDVNFKQFDPKGQVSIYEFLSQYEEWARGYISDESKAHLLFTKYLPKSLTDAYDELKQRKHNYDAMKNWLVDNFGVVSAVARPTSKRSKL